MVGSDGLFDFENVGRLFWRSNFCPGHRIIYMRIGTIFSRIEIGTNRPINGNYFGLEANMWHFWNV